MTEIGKVRTALSQVVRVVRSSSHGGWGSSTLSHAFPALELLYRAQGRAPPDLLADAVLVLEDIEGAVRDLLRPLSGDHDEAAQVTDDPVAGPDSLSSDDHLDADLAMPLRF